MKKIILICILMNMTIFCMTTFAEEKGYSFTGFSEIHYSIPGTLYLTQADEYQIVLKATKKQMDEVVIQKRGNSLVISCWETFNARP